MAKPFDLSKFRKDITKSITGLSIGFNDPTDWISTGNYALNYLISGDFFKGVPLGKVTTFSGDSGAGKSLICSGNIVKNAQDAGIYVILIDTESALDSTWLTALGVDVSEDKLLKLNCSMVDEIGKIISEFVSEYKKLDPEERPKVLFVIDSLGMTMVPTQVDQFNSGEVSKGDFGRKPKALKALVTNCVNMFGNLNIGLIATNHQYSSQDPYNPDPIASGGSGFIFASSILVAMKKLKLKEDNEGNKTTTVQGIRAGCKIMKTRYAKPFEDIEVHIPYDTGVEPYSGLFDLIEKRGLFNKEGNRYVYVDGDGKEYRYFRKEWNKNTDGALDLVMIDIMTRDKDAPKKTEEIELDAPDDFIDDEISSVDEVSEEN